MTKLIFLSALLLLTSCVPDHRKSYQVIRIDGSSTVFPLTEAASEEFQTNQRGTVRITVGVAGTGGGFKKFCRGETDLQNASRAITPEEKAKCEGHGIQYLELPIAIDAIAIITHKDNTWLNQISVSELKKMWSADSQNTVMKWSDVNPKWPDEKLSLFGASTDNGTFDYFTEVINGKAKSSRGDYTASVDHNTRATGVAANHFALGYIPLPYYMANKEHLKLIPVLNDKNEAVLPTPETARDGQYRPLSRPLYIYVRKDSLRKKEVLDFVNYYIQQAIPFSLEVQDIPMKESHYKDLLGQVKVAAAEIAATPEKIPASAN